MHTPTVGSLFSGYGGLDLAVEAFFGARTVWHCQYDPEDPHQYAAAILAHHYPDVPNHGDITAVDWGQVEPVDILTGGFPCTDLSLAGTRAGLNDQTRSGLWLHMARAIEALRPRLVVIENVRGLLSAPAAGNVEPCTWCLGDDSGEPALRALGAVLADLARLGFDAEWLGLPASAVGAPHERWREFILAWPADPQGPRLEVRGIPGRPAGSGPAAADADQLGAHRPRPLEQARVEPADGGGVPAAADTDRDGVRVEPVAEPGGDGPAVAELAGSDASAYAAVGRLAELGGVPSGRDAVRGREGGADAPRCGAADADAGRGGRGTAEPDVQPGEPDSGRRAPADAEGNRRGEGRPEPARLSGGPDAPLGSAPDWGQYAAAVRRWEHVLGRPAPAPVDDRGRLHPAFVEWMMGLPAGWITGIPIPDGMTSSKARNAQLKAGGNGVVPQQALAALAELWRRATATQPVPAAA